MTENEPVTVERAGEHVALVTLRRPPHNYFDVTMIRRVADVYDAADADPSVRVIVLASEGRNFCAGANFGGDGDRTTAIAFDDAPDGATALYAEATRVFSIGTPVVAAVQGIAIGGGLGLAVSADFRVAGPSTRFCANFSRLGLHQGFGLSVSLPRVVGHQHALDMLLTGRRVGAEEAFRFGLADRLVQAPDPAGEPAAIREAALALAAELAEAAPLAVRSIRATQRAGLAEEVTRVTAHEAREQATLRATADVDEGIAASLERRAPRFTGR
ncbi:enoyl-CoA hydratase/isomerase family protein [Pseudonocardia sp. KRD291]|uniref:enoyl-CoA hydratase/isomerase family protein n=1 Tax=Pseudonocardia sp. KRD291 TaxID=2792007 RepID=UPI001C5C1074|nr:enoyl-CoA hydratase/isomerase family protein [Pseudonocardia sp. KRD291]MBW0105352.1 enoyl-CoA hydratase/isomerase family protein [Pseudonocardia sp. KRD291]